MRNTGSQKLNLFLLSENSIRFSVFFQKLDLSNGIDLSLLPLDRQIEHAFKNLELPIDRRSRMYFSIKNGEIWERRYFPKTGSNRFRRFS